MAEYIFKQPDFENPSFLFRLEDKLKILFGRSFYQSYLKSFALNGNEHVLDFGCGGGVESRLIMKQLKNSGKLTCVDLSDYWTRRAKKRLKKYPNAVCLQGDIRKLNIPENTFDVIFAIHVIHDIAPEKRQSTVNALVQKLKPGGVFFIWEPTKISHGMAVEEIRALLSHAGLKEKTHKKTKSSYKGEFKL